MLYQKFCFAEHYSNTISFHKQHLNTELNNGMVHLFCLPSYMVSSVVSAPLSFKGSPLDEKYVPPFSIQNKKKKTVQNENQYKKAIQNTRFLKTSLTLWLSDTTLKNNLKHTIIKYIAYVSHHAQDIWEKIQ